MQGFDGHAALMKQLIEKLEEEERPWYEQASRTAFYWWHAVSTLAVLISVTAAITAELIDGKEFDAYGKVILTVLPIISTALSAFSSHFRFHDKEALREAGRIEIEAIIADAKSKAASALDDAGLEKAYIAVRNRAYQLEMKQHTFDVALRSKSRAESSNDES